MVIGDDDSMVLVRIENLPDLAVLQAIPPSDLEQEFLFFRVHAAIRPCEREQIPDVVLLIGQILMLKKSDHNHSRRLALPYSYPYLFCYCHAWLFLLQGAPQDLAHVRLRKLLLEFNMLGNLVVGEVLVAIFL